MSIGFKAQADSLIRMSNEVLRRHACTAIKDYVKDAKSALQKEVIPTW